MAFSQEVVQTLTVLCRFLGNSTMKCLRHRFICAFLFPLLFTGNASAVELVPARTGDDTTQIQSALDDLKAGDTILLNGDFVFGHTLYLPSSNKRQGVAFRNKQPDGIIENNVIDILVYGNQGLNDDGTLSDFAGGLGTEGSPISGLTGSVIGYDNGGYDVNIRSAMSCTLTVYIPDDRAEPVIASGASSNSVGRVSFSCPSVWSIQNYREVK